MLSGGFVQRLLIARSIVHRPSVLFLDEPTTGLDPSARLDVWELIDELLVIHEGRKVAHGEPP